MNEYRLVINLNNSSITTKQVGEDGLFKIRKVDGFRAYPCESKSDVQEYFDKLKRDCFNVSNFTKENFNVILLRECSNQEIVDAVKAEIQDTTFTVLDSTFSKAFNSDDNNAEDLDELSQKNSYLSSEKDALTTKLEKISNENESLKKSNELTKEQVSQLSSKLSFYNNVFGSIVGYFVTFGRDNYNKPLRWLVYDIKDNCLALTLAKGIPSSKISKKELSIEQDVYSYLNKKFLEKFTSDELAIMQPCSKNSNDKVGLPGKNEITKILQPILKESENTAQSTTISVVKDSISFGTNLSNQILLKNNKIYQLKSESIVDLNEFLNRNQYIPRGSFSSSIYSVLSGLEQKDKSEIIRVYPVIKVQLETIE